MFFLIQLGCRSYNLDENKPFQWTLCFANLAFLCIQLQAQSWCSPVPFQCVIKAASEIIERVCGSWSLIVSVKRRIPTLQPDWGLEGLISQPSEALTHSERHQLDLSISVPPSVLLVGLNHTSAPCSCSLSLSEQAAWMHQDWGGANGTASCVLATTLQEETVLELTKNCFKQRAALIQ